MTAPEEEIREIVNRETKAWNTQDVELLLSVFHQDMVWLWPPANQDHDPMTWIMLLGKFDHIRWKKSFSELFQNHTLRHNRREIKKIEISEEGDGAFAVVDIDTLWAHKNDIRNHWKGRVCKVYSKTDQGWKMTMHTGALEY